MTCPLTWVEKNVKRKAGYKVHVVVSHQTPPGLPLSGEEQSKRLKASPLPRGIEGGRLELLAILVQEQPQPGVIHGHAVLLGCHGHLFVTQRAAGMGHKLDIAAVGPVDVVAERDIGIG